MNTRLNVLALGAILASTAFLLGCGGNNNSGSSMTPSSSSGASSGLAPASVNGQQITLTSAQAGQSAEFVTFNNDATYSANSGTNASAGTFTYNKTANNAATLVLTENGTGAVTTVQLTFNAAASGSFTSSSSNGQTANGSFVIATASSAGTGGGGASGGTAGGSSGGGTSGTTGGTGGGGTSGTTGSGNGSNSGSSGTTGGTTLVQIMNFSFQPSAVNLKVGDTVMWIQDDATIHTTTSDSGVWDSGNLNQNQSFSFTFKTAGIFPYHCAIHPFMKGSVNVTM